MSRAVCCRISDDFVNKLLNTYSINHPLLCQTTHKSQPVKPEDKMDASLNWSSCIKHDYRAELVDGILGHTKSE